MDLNHPFRITARFMFLVLGITLVVVGMNHLSFPAGADDGSSTSNILVNATQFGEDVSPRLELNDRNRNRLDRLDPASSGNP